MKTAGIIIIVALATCITACEKTAFITSPGAAIETSSDSLYFDTVFTTAGSVTQSFKVFNPNNQSLRISNIQLAGGAQSAFKLNVQGVPGVTFNNIDIAPGDSIYVFVSVSVNPNNTALPFIIRDSITIGYNTNQRQVQLSAFGQNAHFMRGASIVKDTSWSNELPFVILGSLTVQLGATLTIHQGAKIYCHADAPIVIDGTLKTNGEKYDSTRVIFTGDRLDAPYRDFPAAWPGIIFSASSKDNSLQYTVVKNAYQAIVVAGPSVNASPKLSLSACIIGNAYDAGIYAIAGSIYAENCLLINCGANLRITAGGDYTFINCTLASYDNIYIEHKSPVLFISNTSDNNQALPLQANFVNDIFWGDGGKVDDEIVLGDQVKAADVQFNHVLYKAKKQVAATLADCIQNQEPQFVTVDVPGNYYDFHLQSVSPCAGAGLKTGVTTDLDGKTRASQPSIGCYD